MLVLTNYWFQISCQLTNVVNLGAAPLFLSSRSFFAFVFSFSVWALPLVVVVDCPLPRHGAAQPVGLADDFQPYLSQQTESLILSSIKRTNISIEKELATRVPKTFESVFGGLRVSKTRSSCSFYSEKWCDLTENF